MIKIMIIDDEQAACSIMKVLIEKHVPGEKEIRLHTSPVSALQDLPVFKPSLVMLDIEMPEMTGFDFLNRAGGWNFDVVFTTAYDRYAIKAIRFSALDYLIKPVDIPELQNAINRHIVRRDFKNNDRQELVDNLLYNLKQKDHQQFKLALSTSEGIFLFELRDIIMLEGNNNYTKFFFAHQKPLIVAKTLKEYEDMLQPQQFARVHKSYLINKNHVQKVDREGMIQLSNQMSVPVSRRKRSDVFKMFANAVD